MKQIKKSLCILLVVVVCLTSAPFKGFADVEWPEINVVSWFIGGAKAVNEDSAETLYRYRVKEYITSTNENEEGYTMYDSTTTYGSWGSYGEWTKTRQTVSDVKSEESKTAYWFVHYCTNRNSEGKECFAPNDSYTYGEWGPHYTYSTSLPTLKESSDASVTKLGYKLVDRKLTGCNKTNTGYYYYKVGEGQTTAYRYRTRSRIVTYYYYKWSDWSEWSSEPVEKTKDVIVEKKVNGKVFREGFCGENVTYRLAEDDTLTISGEGPMYDFCWDNKDGATMPQYMTWNYDEEGFITGESTIKKVVIESGVTTIGDYAFNACIALESVDISDTVTSIGATSFDYCIALKKICIPGSVKVIEEEAFSESGLEIIEIKNGLERIEQIAFLYCQNLTTLYLPRSLTDVDDFAFTYCDNLQKVYYTGTEEQWNKINIGENNECLTNATIYFDSDISGLNQVKNGYKREHVIDNWKYLNQSYKSEYLAGFAVPMDGTNGNPNYLIPGQTENMIPQGLAYWSEKDWILISSYDKEKENPSVIFALDRATGDFVAQFNLKENKNNKIIDWLPHAGGIGVSDNNLYITNGGGISYFPLRELDVERGSVKDIVRVGYADVAELGNAYVSYLDVSDGILWAGNFYSNYPGISIWEELLEKVGVLPSSWDTPANKNNDSLVLGFKLTGTTSETEWENLKNIVATATYRIGIPKGIDCIQGVTFKKISDTKYKMYLSRTTDVSFSANISSTTIALKKSQINPNKDDFCFLENLPGAENIIFIDDDLYTVYESAALSTCDDLVSQATWNKNLKNCTDVIWKVNENDLMQIPQVDATWFENDAYSGYNHELAKFCADYCLLGYSYSVDEVAYFLNKSGFAVNTDYINMSAARDEVNHFIADKNIIVNGESKNLIFIGCIGSYTNQWYSNFDPWGTENIMDYTLFEGEHTHQGFANAREFVLGKINEYLLDNNIDRSNSIFLLTGHSRGSATVNLLAAKLIDSASTYSLNAANIYTYGFATPNTTKNAYGICLDKYSSIKNIVNPEDLVTKLLPSSWGYGRYGDTYTLPSRTNTEKSDYNKLLKKVQKYMVLNGFNGSYTPFELGERAVYNLMKEMSDSLSGVDDFYNKRDLYTGQSTFQYFKNHIIPFVAGDTDWKDLASTGATILKLFTLQRKITAFFIDHQAIEPEFEESHSMETYAAFVNVMTSTEITIVRKGYEGSVNCPVDVEIYDKQTGELVGRIVDNVVDEEVAAGDNAIVMTVEGDSKSFWLPSNGDYDIKLIGNDEGTMDYTMCEIDPNIGEIKRVNFFDVKITDGLTMTADVEGEDFIIEEHELVYESGETLESTEVLGEEEITIYNIEISSAKGGFASTSQTAKSGDYVNIEAQPENGWKFIGWYENDELVSTESNYAFVSKSNKNLEARFEHIDHNFGDWYTVTPTKCEVVGMKQHDCSVCDYSETQGISATGHDFDGSKCRNCDYDKSANCECNCHKSGFMGVIWNLLRFFYKLFRTNKVCNCGVAHY